MNLAIPFLLLSILASSSNTAGSAETVSTPETLWDEWYAVHENGVASGYYNDRVESLPDGRIKFSNQLTRKMGKLTIEESGKSFAKRDDSLKPLIFNYRSSTGTEEIIVDATVEASQQLTARVQENKVSKPVITRKLDSGAIFSSFYPVLLSRKLKALKAGKKVDVPVVLESDTGGGFAPVPTTAKIDKPDPTAKQLGAVKIRVVLGDQINFWYLDSRGVPLRIEFPQSNTVVQRVTEAQAKGLFK